MTQPRNKIKPPSRHFRTALILTQGFALTELLLALVIAVPFALISIRALTESMERSAGTINSEKTADFTEMAKNYYLANTSAMKAAMVDGTGASLVCRLGVDPLAATPETTGIQSNSVGKHTCAIDMAFLRWKQLAPAGASDLNTKKQRLVAIFRVVYDTATNTATDDVELLSVGASAVTGIANYAPNSIGESRGLDPLVMDANAMGASGGVIPDADRGICKYVAGDMTQSEACGVQGGWRVKLSNFLS